MTSKTKNTHSSNFENFTHLYSLSKTLKFELIPVKNTEKLLQERGIVTLDKSRYESYQKTKIFIDKFHNEFISGSLTNVKLTSLNDYIDIYSSWKNEKNKDIRKIKQKKLINKESQIRKDIVALFDAYAVELVTQYRFELPNINFKKVSVDFLFETDIFKILKNKYGDETETMINNESIFDGWDNWHGYFTKFFETRKNFYKSDGTSTAVATRIVENLRKFVDNLDEYKKVSLKLPLKNLEKEHNVKLKDVFCVDFYAQCLNQIGIDKYNRVIGGFVDKISDAKTKGLNQYINEYRQKTSDKLSHLKQLNKQIGSDKQEFFSVIETDEELVTVVSNFLTYTQRMIFGDQKGDMNDGGFDACIKVILGEVENFDHIYIRKDALNTIVYRWFTNGQEILSAIVKSGGGKFDNKGETIKLHDFVSFGILKSALELLFVDNTQRSDIWKNHYYEKDLVDHDKMNPWEQFLQIFKHEYENVKSIKDSEQKILLYDYSVTVQKVIKTTDIKNEKTIEIIKKFADQALSVYQFAKYFSLEKKRHWNPDGLDENQEFYALYTAYLGDAYEQIVQSYNKIRNYLTKKPFNEEKWLLNFENPKLASGWDKNKERDNSAVILKNDGKYYLGVIDKNNNKIFEDIPKTEKKQKKGFEKMEYKYFPGASKMIPKCTISTKDVKEHFIDQDIDFVFNIGSKFTSSLAVSKRIFELATTFYRKDDVHNSFFPKDKTEEKDGVKKYQKGYLQNGGNVKEYRQSLHEWINFCKNFLLSYKSTAIFDWSSLKPTSEYIDLQEFYDDVNFKTYELKFISLPFQYVENLNNDGKLFLFEIHNKDFNLKNKKIKTGTKNLHTIYFENLFSKVNSEKHFPFKLNGEAELFFRPATEVDRLGIRKDCKNNDVIKNKRYAKDKYLFHVPITLNRIAQNTKFTEAKNFNTNINKYLAHNKDINIIGIDRGEKHLAYVCIINQRGEIIETKSLNTLKQIPFAELLEKRAQEREQSRKDWKNIEQIKNLKKGYISFVVNEIADLIVKHNAIVVLEDLNMRFKQVRGGIEKSVYQQLEKALIDKLNFLVDKKVTDSHTIGNAFNAYQLTSPINTFSDMGKQTGILFYTEAGYTSTTDPITGFRKNLYISNSASVEKIKEALKKFEAIGWNSKINSYFFSYDPINFVDKKFKKNMVSKVWTVYAHVPRIKRENENGYWKTIRINPNDKLRELLTLWNFDDLVGDLKNQIIKMEKNGNLQGTKFFDGKQRNFWHSLIYLFNLILQIRNSTSTQYTYDDDGKVTKRIEGVDYISSPVVPFFCTDGGEYTKGLVNLKDLEEKIIGTDSNHKKSLKEFNGDTNGAYNIARKGIIILNKLSQNQEKPDLYVSRKDWDTFLLE